MDTQPTTSTLKIDFSASPLWFRAMRHHIISATRHCGFEERDAGQVAMAVDEALCNIYRHGYHGDSNGPITIRVQTTTKPNPHVQIDIEDEAEHTDIDTIKSRDLKVIRPGGLGVHLITSIMDKAIWAHRNPTGMKLTMHKTFHATTEATQVTEAHSNG